MTTVLVRHYYYDKSVATVQRTISYVVYNNLLLSLVIINTNFQVSTLILVFLTLECVIRAQVLLADHSNGGCAQCVWLRATH